MISGNGIDTGPLAGWVIVTEQGIRYLGRVDGPLLRPAYELLVGFGMTPQGQMTVTRQAIPIMTFASIESWKPRDDASVVMVDGSLDARAKGAPEGGPDRREDCQRNAWRRLTRASC